MTHDELLQGLGAAARQRSGVEDDPRWDRLAQGELSDAEEAELKEEARRDPEVARFYEAFRPLSNEAKDAIAAHLQPPSPAAKVSSARVWRRSAIAAVPLAAAAAAVLFLHAREAPRAVGADEGALPSYVLDVSGDRAARSEATPTLGTVTLHRDTRLEVLVHPAVAVAGPIAARAFLARDGVAHVWDVPIQISANGAVRITGIASDLLAKTPGAWDLVLVVGRPGALPTDPSAALEAARTQTAPGAWRALSTRVAFVDAP